MFGMGTGELLIILVIVVIIFGVGKLPELGTGLGTAIRNFKKATNEGLDAPHAKEEGAAKKDA